MNILRRHWPLLTVLAAVAVLLRFPRPMAEDPSSVSPSSKHRQGLLAPLFGGGLRQLWIEKLWREAESLESAGRIWEIAAVFDELGRIAGDDPKVWQVQARYLVWQLGRGETDDADRWRLYRLALTHLHHGLERHPRDFLLRELEYRIFDEVISRDPWCARQYEKATGFSPLETAISLAGSLHQDFPEAAPAADAYLSTAERVTLLLLERNRLGAAATSLEELARVSEDIDRRFSPEPSRPSPGFCRRFAALLRRLIAVTGWEEGKIAPEAGRIDAKALAAVLDESLADLSPRPPIPGLAEDLLDAGALRWLDLRVVRLIQVLVLGDSDSAALHLIPQASRIAGLAADSSAFGSPYYSKVYVELLSRFIESDRGLLESVQSGSTPSPETRRIWLEQLDSLERSLAVEGRPEFSDGFKKRLLGVRH